MEVLIWQIGIIISIVLASAILGRRGLVWSVVIASVWTAVMIFTSWLMILQFFTIALAGIIGAVICDKKNTKENEIYVNNSSVLTEARNTEKNYDNLHFLHVAALCAVGGWILALDQATRYGTGHNKLSFFELLFNAGFIGMAAAPALFLCGAAILGWIVGKLIKPIRTYASWAALIFAVALFFALQTGGDIGDRRALMPSELVTEPSKAAPLPAPPKNAAPRPAQQASVPTRLYALAAELKGEVPKQFSTQTMLVNAWVEGNSLHVLLHAKNYTAADLDAQIPSFNQDFNREIARYYCSSQPYRSLLNQGATVVVSLSGKDMNSIGSYPISMHSCEE